MMVGPWPKGRWFDSEPKQYFPGFRGTVGESRRKILLMSSRLSAGLRRLLAKHTSALLGMQSTVWGDSLMLPSRGVRVWVVYLTPKIERVISLLSASPVGEARCRCHKVWFTRIDYYYFTVQPPALDMTHHAQSSNPTHRQVCSSILTQGRGFGMLFKSGQLLCEASRGFAPRHWW
jgi:hypothetical protein